MHNSLHEPEAPPQCQQTKTLWFHAHSGLASVEAWERYPTLKEDCRLTRLRKEDQRLTYLNRQTKTN